MKDDKKKLVVVGVLVLAVVAIGAFQMTKGTGGPPTPVKTAAKTDAKKGTDAKTGDPKAGDKADPPKNPLYVQALTPRDPFAVPASALPPKTPDPVKTPTPPPLKGGPKWGAGQDGPRFTGPYNPMGPGQLPGAEGLGGAQITETGPPPDVFSYQLSGVIVGAKPMAVFTDAQGNQRLVAQGGSIDPDSKVLSIEKGKVTVVHKSKKLELVLGGNPSEK